MSCNYEFTENLFFLQKYQRYTPVTSLGIVQCEEQPHRQAADGGGRGGPGAGAGMPRAGASRISTPRTPLCRTSLADPQLRTMLM